MDKATLKQMHSVTKRCESLQIKLAAKKDESREHRQAYERVAEAKERLMDALHVAEAA